MTKPTQSDSLDVIIRENVQLGNDNGQPYIINTDDAVDAIQALYAPKPDETVEKILQAVYNNGRMADKKLLETNKEDILPWMSVNQAEAVLAAHYAAKEQEAVLRARIDELNRYKIKAFKIDWQYINDGLADLTNQLNQLKGEK